MNILTKAILTKPVLILMLTIVVLLGFESCNLANRAQKAETQIAAQNASEADENATIFTSIYGRPPTAGKPSPRGYVSSTQRIVREKLRELHAQEAEARRRTELACGGGRQAFEDYGKPFFQAKRLEAIRVAWYFDYDTAPWKE